MSDGAGAGAETGEFQGPRAVRGLHVADLLDAPESAAAELVRRAAPLLVLLPDGASPPIPPLAGRGPVLDGTAAARLDAVRAAPGLRDLRCWVALGRTSREGVLVGRAAEDCDVVLDLPSVSRRHAALRGTAGRWTVTDLGSSNGTYVESSRLGVEAPAPLRSGTLLRVGSVRFLFLLPDHAGVLLPAPAAPPPAAPAAPAAVRLPPEGLALRSVVEMRRTGTDLLGAVGAPFLLEVPVEAPGEPEARAPAGADVTRVLTPEEVRALPRSRHAGRARVFAVVVRGDDPRGVLVGRGEDCDVRLGAPSPSRHHARLVPRRGGGWQVVDLDSRNGTWVDGRRCPAGLAVPLHEGANLWFAGFRTVFLEPASLAGLVQAL